VGLADALVHDPPVLLLDEPSSGLDPNQIREMRQTLKDLAAEKTLVLSTHILPEVESVCDHLVVIHRGRIVMKGALAELREGFSESGPLAVEGRGGDPEAMEKALRGLNGVRSVERKGDGSSPAWSLETEVEDGVRESVYRLFKDRGWVLLELARKSPTLEEMFWKVTIGGDLETVGAGVGEGEGDGG
jgi:ABC-2 type transport system ATP-binding protein